MGMFDTVVVSCPKCGYANDFQSKGGSCDLMVYTLENAPFDVLTDINRHSPAICSGCGSKYKVKIKKIKSTKSVKFKFKPKLV